MELKIKIIIVLSLLLFFSCTLTQRESNNEIDKRTSIIDNFEIRFLDSITFKDYIFMGLLDNKEKNFYLISKRIETINYVDSTNYEVMKIGETYKIHIIKQDSLISVKSKTPYTLSEYADIEKNLIIWSNDTVRTTVYMSPNVLDKYVEIIK